MENIQHTKNVVYIPWKLQGSVHKQITGYYNRVYTHIDGTHYSNFRSYVKTLPFDEQYEQWLKILKLYWGDIYIK